MTVEASEARCQGPHHGRRQPHDLLEWVPEAEALLCPGCAEREPDTIFLGTEGFRASGTIGHLALLAFARAAQTGISTEDMAGLAAMHRLLETVVHPDDWQRFNEVADRDHVEIETLLACIAGAVAGGSRPTSRSSASSDGPLSTKASSPAGSFWPVVREEEAAGRPDRAAFVLLANRDEVPGLAHA